MAIGPKSERINMADLDLVVRGIYTDETGTAFAGTGVTASAAEINALDITAAGTVQASKAVVVDTNKDAAAFRNVTVTNLDAGASATAGTVDIFPTTAAKGKIAITAADNTNNDTTTIVNAAQSGAWTYTIPDAGASTSFLTSAGAQTITGVKNFSFMPLIPCATVAALGTVQGDAAAITTGFTLVSGADAAKGVILPTAAPGLVAIVKNGANAVLKIWPNTSDAINAIAANSSLDIAALTSVVLVSYDATTWYSVPLLPS